MQGTDAEITNKYMKSTQKLRVTGWSHFKTCPTITNLDFNDQNSQHLRTDTLDAPVDCSFSSFMFFNSNKHNVFTERYEHVSKLITAQHRPQQRY